MSNKRAYWLRIRAYRFADLVPPDLWDHVVGVFGTTDASTHAFAAKIANKYGWSTRFALRAVSEYRKFLFLGVTGSVPVTPSKIIDIVWHEHLLFTRAYRTFCRDVLEQDFDHHPELVATGAQTDTYATQYRMTIERYRYEFRIDPPMDIWGTTKFDQPKDVADRNGSDGGSVYIVAGDEEGEGPLFAQFDGQGDTPSYQTMPEFNADGGSESTGDSSSGEGGGDGAGGGSGCSSGCGGGCGGD